jgi:3-phosphoshikimate 1-carboxyvinyltransferase
MITGGAKDLQISISGSKSESNRALILQAFASDRIVIENLSDSDDTRALIQALELASSSLGLSSSSSASALSGSSLSSSSISNSNLNASSSSSLSSLSNSSSDIKIDCGHAGSTFRFLAAYFAGLVGKEIILTGSEQLQQRPMAPLISALQALGANITYLAQEGFAPIRISGKNLQASNVIEIDSSKSSQYISALLLIGSQLAGGLNLHLSQSRVSKAYIQMTIALLKQAEIMVSDHQDQIHIAEQKIKAHTFYIEPDWSSASYWYAIKALGYSGKIFLKGLKKDSVQGDACIASLMENYGVQTIYHAGGIEIIAGTICKEPLLIDCIDCPDLAPTLIATAAALRLPYRFTGLQTLAHKESNRTEALSSELAKIGVKLSASGAIFSLAFPSAFDYTQALVFETHHDHRMAMCLAPLALQWPNITIKNADVVEKSYRSFWDDFAQTGLSLNLQ